MKKVITLIFLIGFWGCSGKKNIADEKNKSEKSKITDIYNYENAANHLRIGKYSDGLLILQKIQSKHTTDPVYWNTLGMAFRLNSFIEGDNELRKKEIDAFRKALSLKPDDTVIIINLASALAETGDKTESCALFKKIITQLEKHPDFESITEIVNGCNGKQPEKPADNPVAPASEGDPPKPMDSSELKSSPEIQTGDQPSGQKPASGAPAVPLNEKKQEENKPAKDQLQKKQSHGNNISAMNAPKTLTMVPPMN